MVNAAVIGDGLAVHHADRRERHYLSFGAAGSANPLPGALDEVEAFFPDEMITTVAHAGQAGCRGQPAERARAVSGTPREGGGPGQTATTPPGHGQPWGRS